MNRMLVLSTLFAAAIAAPSYAATPRSYAALDRQTSAACIVSSGLRNATVGPVIRFSDSFVMDARTLTGTYPQPHMKGAKGTMLCLYNRRTKQAEVQEMVAAEHVVETSNLKDIWWRGTDIGGHPVGSSPVTLMFGSDGKIGGKSACNNYSANYTLTNNDLRVYPGMIGTRMACPANVMAQEMQFQRLLTEANLAIVQSDGTMTVRTPQGKSLRFTRARASTN